jgi:hypothetical protein
MVFYLVQYKRFFWLLFIISFDTYKTDGAHLWNQYFFVVSRVSSASELTGNSDLILLQQKTVLQTGKTFYYYYRHSFLARKGRGLC